MRWGRRRPEPERLQPYTRVTVTYRPVTPEEIAAFQLRRRLLQRLGSTPISDAYAPVEQYDPPYDNSGDGSLEDSIGEPLSQAETYFQSMLYDAQEPFREAQADVQRMLYEAQQPFRDAEADFQRMFDELDRPFRELEADFQRTLDEMDAPFRQAEADMGCAGAPNLGDTTVIDGRTYMVTGTTTQYGVRRV